MQDRKMKALGLFTALSLAVCLVASGIVSNTGSSYAATSSLKWTQITIPDEGDMQLYPGSDIGPMAVSPDGMTVFAAVQNESSGNWELLKSIDGAFTWRGTGLSGAMAAKSPADTSGIVAIEISPSWGADGRVYVATNNSVYSSVDRGRAFAAVTAVKGTIYYSGAVPPYDVITSLALGADSSGHMIVAVGTANPAITTTDVYILDEGVWSAQGVGAYDVLAVELSPSYATDNASVAVVTDGTQTRVRTKRLTGGWGITIPDAIFKDQNGNDFWSSRACIGLPDNYNAISQTACVLTYFVGLSAPGPLGDVFRVDGGWLTSSSATDINVRGNISATDSTETNIWSMAVSGSTSNMVIIVGTVGLNLSALPTPPGQFLVYTGFGSVSAINWIPGQSSYKSCKQPTGQAKATVVMTSSVAYAGTFGNQSAVSVGLSSAEDGGFSSWNQRGLIDTAINEITDMSPSEEYYADGTMHIITYDSGTGDASLWRTVTEGRVWERLYCSTLAVNSSTLNSACVFNMVRLAGSAIIVAQSGGKVVIYSDNGLTFSFDPWNTTIGNAPEDITAFAVEDASTYYAGDAKGVVRRWTDNSGAWTSSTGSEIPSSDRVVDIVLMKEEGVIYAGTNNGGLYKSNISDLEFAQVGPSKPGTLGDIVYIAPDPCDESFIYVGISGGAPEVWRFDMSDDEAEWEQLEITGTAVGDLSSIACSDCIGADSVLYAISTEGKGWRWVDPTNTRETPVSEEIVDASYSDSVRRGMKLFSGYTNILFAIGGASYNQIWTASDEILNLKLLAPEDDSIAGTILEDEAFPGRAVVILEWKEVEGAESYEVQISFNESMRSPVDMSYYADGHPYSNGMVKVAYPWLGTKCYWRVRVGKAGSSGSTEGAPLLGQWSDVWSFTTPLGPAPSVPGLLFPEPGQENVKLRPVLQWNSSIAATGYELILAINCDWDNPVLNLSGESAVSDTAYQLTFDLAKNTNYCWKVRGVNDITHSPWSDSLSFTTGVTSSAEDGGLSMWIWVIIALGAVLMLSMLVLIAQSRKY